MAAAAAQLAVCRNTVTKALPVVRVGGALRIRQSDIDKLIEPDQEETT